MESNPNVPQSFPTSNLSGAPMPQSPMNLRNSPKTVIMFAVVSLLFLILAAAGLYLFTREDQKNNQRSTVKASATPVPQTQQPLDSQAFVCTKMVFEYQSEKYPIPSKIPAPQGLEDQLYDIYIADAQTKEMYKYDGKEPQRVEFKLQEYYGDVAMGSMGSSGSTAQWVMNKTNNQWKVIIAGSQETPTCQQLEPFINDLKEWQGLCYDDDKMTDILHPNEPYNACN